MLDNELPNFGKIMVICENIEGLVPSLRELEPYAFRGLRMLTLYDCHSNNDV